MKTDKKAKGAVNIFLGLALALGIYLVHTQQKDKKEFNELLPVLQEQVHAKFDYKSKPTAENKLKLDAANKALKTIDDKIEKVDFDRRADTQKYFEDRGYLYSEDPLFLLKIDRIKGNVHYAKSKDKRFRGIGWVYNEHGTPSFFKYNNKIIVNETKIDGLAKETQEYWHLFTQNNTYFETNDPRWKPARQALYNALKNSPRDKIAETYKKIKLRAGVAHEKQHIADDKQDKYSIKNREKRALLTEMAVEPYSTLHILEGYRNSKSSDHYVKAIKEILNEAFGDIKDIRDIYRLDEKEISRRAEKVFDKYNN